jgi:hypothetical protein
LFGYLPELYGVDRWSHRGRSAVISATLKLDLGRGRVAQNSSGQIKGYLMRSS